MQLSNRWLKYFIWLNLTSLSILFPNFPCGNKHIKASCSQNVSLKIDVGCFPSPGAMLISSHVNKIDTKNVFWELNLWTSKGFSIFSESSPVPIGSGISSLANDNILSGCYQHQHLRHCIVNCSLVRRSAPDLVILAELLQNKHGPCKSTYTLIW